MPGSELIVSAMDMPDSGMVAAGNMLGGRHVDVVTKLAYGNEVSLLVGSLPAGYKSRPHVQQSEQITHVRSGELWVFVSGKAYHVRTADFIRIPTMAVHWMWNRSDGPAEIYEFNSGPLVGAAKGHRTGAELITSSEVQPDERAYITWLSDRYVREVEAGDLTSEEGGLLVRDADLPDSVHLTSEMTGRLSSKFVYAQHLNLMLARRAAGYHSPPHLHACDQMNYLIEGELWIFLENQAYYLRPGDFMRVPKMTAHWAFNPGEGDCLLIEGHSPVLDPRNKPYAHRLKAGDNEPPVAVVDNLWLPETLAEREEALMRDGIKT